MYKTGKVGMFFATCYWDKGLKQWRPLSKEQTEQNEKSQYGLIYHMPSNMMTTRWSTALEKYQLFTNKVVGQTEEGLNRYEKLEHPVYRGEIPNLVMPIGFQPFMRCSMQNGYGIYMREPKPLQTDWGFEKLKFRHSEKLSNAVFERMKGGELIYPHEGLKQAGFILAISDVISYNKANILIFK